MQSDFFRYAGFNVYLEWFSQWLCYFFRLDCAFCNSLFLDSWSQIACLTLPRSHSNHFPLLLDCTLEVSSGPKPFHFQGMWLSHPTFLDLVKRVWSFPQVGSSMSQLIAKLKLLKRELKVWNWSIFGDLNRSISATQDQIFVIQNRLASEGHSDDLLRLEMEAIADLDKLLSQQEVFLLEQSHVKWLKEGDRNSSFFHNVLKHCRSKKLLSHMKIGDEIVENVDQISLHL